MGLVVGLLPGVAHANFDPGGTRVGHAELDIPDGPVGTGNFSVVGEAMTVRGRSFVANDRVLIFECARGETDLVHNCVTLKAALSDSNGDFSADIQGLYRWASPSGTQHSCQQKFEGFTGTGSIDQCSIAAATYDTFLQPTSMADHYLCFGGFDDGCSTNRDGTPMTTTTTTTPPPPNEWEPTASMNVARRDLATAVGADGRIYALGGTATAEYTGGAITAAEVFDPCGKRTWSAIAPMPTPRVQFAAATGPDGLIYAIGGRSSGGGTPLASVDAYDPSTNTWSTVASLVLPRADLSATTGPDGLIYAIGGSVAGNALTGVGYADGLPTSTVEAYDTATNQWRLVTPLPLPRGDIGAATGPDGRVYAMGGPSLTATVEDRNDLVGAMESYAPGPAGTPGTWRREASPSDGFYPSQAAVTTGPDGLIYAIGGDDYGTSLRSVRIFNTDPAASASAWTISQEPLLTPRSGHGAAAGKDGRIYAIGGIDGQHAVDPAPPLASTEAAKVAPSSCAPGPPPPADFTGDGRSDVSVFRPSNGTWYVKDGTWAGWGADGDIPVPGDYDGDRKADIAIFRPATGLWAIHGSAGADTFVTYGISTDVPIPADYDGDGKTDLAIFRPDYGTWWMHHSRTDADVAITFGISGDVPVPGDYDGDGRADLAIFRNGTWFTLPSSGGAYIAQAYGAPGDIPTPADYDGDHTIDRAVFRPGDGSWWLHHSSDNADENFTFGAPGDVPEPGDYNGDGIADPATFRPATGQWSIETGETYSWGIGTDIPLPLPAAVRMAFFGP